MRHAGEARAWVLLAALACVWLAGSRVSSAQAPASLAGDWTLDRAHSEFPAEVGFGASFMADLPVPPEPAGGGRGRGRGRQGRAPSRTNPDYSRPDSEDDARRIQQLTDAVRTPPINLSIADAGATVTITADGRSRTFHPNGKEESIELDQVPVATVATRIDGGIVVVYHAAEGRDIRFTYWRQSETFRQLVVDAAFVERGAIDSIRRVYVPGTATVPAAPTSTAAASAAPGSPAAPAAPPAAGAPPGAAAPPVAQGPDADLRGLRELGVVVEDLSKQAAGCGLTRDAIEGAVSRSIADGGLSVVREVTSDNNTYVYVNVMTTATASGLCVSRYDVSLLTHTAAKLSYQPAPALVEVQLAHDGSLAGGDAKTHADAVMSGIKRDVDAIVARIRSAGG